MNIIDQLVKDCPWRWQPDQEEFVENGKYCCLGQFNTYQGYHVCHGPKCAPFHFARNYHLIIDESIQTEIRRLSNETK